MFAFELGSGSIVLRVQLSATERLGPAIVGDEGPLPGPRRVDQASRREYSLVGLDPQALFPRTHHSRVYRAVDGKFELLFVQFEVVGDRDRKSTRLNSSH